MQKRFACLVSLPVVLLFAGCGGPGARGKAVFVPIIEKPADASWPFVLPPAAPEPKEAKKGGQKILIYARILAAHPADLAKAGVACDKAFSVLPGAENLKALDALVRERKAQLLSAPRIVAVPGQSATVSVTRAYNYIGDYAPKKSAGPGPGAPVLHTIHSGFILTVCADVAGDGIVFTSVQPLMANAFGVRECKSRMGGQAPSPAEAGSGAREARGKEGTALDWEEPVLLASDAALPAGEKVALQAGASLALPLRDNVRVAVSDLRKRLDQPVEAKTPPNLKFLSKPDPRGFPLPGRIVLILTARAVESGDGGTELPAPSAAPARPATP